MKKLLLPALVALAGFFYILLQKNVASSESRSASVSASRSDNTLEPEELLRAFKEHRSNVRVVAEGVVVKRLPDDDDGARHQRFLLKLPSGQTVLVAHNIDLARRVDFLQRGDRVRLCGEYEWNERGGVIHWTHRDPRRIHPAGWIQHQGRLYQ